MAWIFPLSFKIQGAPKFVTLILENFIEGSNGLAWVGQSPGKEEVMEGVFGQWKGDGEP